MPTKIYKIHDDGAVGSDAVPNLHSRTTSMAHAPSQHRQTFQHQNGSTTNLSANGGAGNQTYGGGGPGRLVKSPGGLADSTLDGNVISFANNLPMFSINEEITRENGINENKNGYYQKYGESVHDYTEENASAAGPGLYNHTHTHSRRKPSVSFAGPNGHRKARSLSISLQEASKQLAPPVSLPLVFLCLSWYACSAFSNTLNKSILNQFPYPVSLSMVQFVLAFSSGAVTIVLSKRFPRFHRMLPAGTLPTNGLLFPPTREIIMTTAPMGCFQLSGHILSHMATRIIPVSLVHTIKALSPLFTVVAYRLIFGVKYKSSTYLTLVPLTIGVMLTCSTEFSAQYMGIFYALVAALIFVSQNMFSKKLLTHSPGNLSVTNNNANVGGSPRKFDKLTILIYCSALAFIFTSPIWFAAEGWGLIKQVYYYQTASPLYTAVVVNSARYSTQTLLTQFWLNGVIHFLQNIISFQVLGMVSPVTYSVASLVKRIVVIVVAIIWFGQKVNWVQGWGIALTFTGLYLYDRFGVDKKSNKVELVKTGVLPK